MGRYRSRSRSYSPRRRSRTPPRRIDHYHHHRQSSASCGLLVRNVALDTRPEDLRIPFEKYGPVKDVYLPRNYYTGEPRGFAFVKFRFPEDAAEAKIRLNHKIVCGREIHIVYAEENHKTPQEMRKRSHMSGRYGQRRRTSPRFPRRQYHSYSKSPAPGRHHIRSVSRSRSPRSGRYHRSAGRSFSPMDHSLDERDGWKTGRFRSSKDISPRDSKGYMSTRRSRSSTEMSPHDGNYKTSRRSHERSISPTKESLSSKNSEERQRTPISREFSSPAEDYRSKKCSVSPLETPIQDEERVNSSHETPSLRELSSNDDRDHWSNHRSKCQGKNCGTPLGDLASSSLVSPRMNGGFVFPSCSSS